MLFYNRDDILKNVWGRWGWGEKKQGKNSCFISSIDSLNCTGTMSQAKPTLQLKLNAHNFYINFIYLLKKSGLWKIKLMYLWMKKCVTALCNSIKIFFFLQHIFTRESFLYGLLFVFKKNILFFFMNQIQMCISTCFKYESIKKFNFYSST